MKSRKLNTGGNQLTREFEVLGSIFVLFAVLIFSVYFGINFASFNLDTRNQAAGRTVFLENGQDLQAAIDSAGPSDAIFLKPGSYTPSSGQGYVIRNKTIRILGAGRDFTTINAGSGNFVFNISNSKVSFESLTITGSRGDGIKVDNGSLSDLSVRDSSITNNSGAGIATEAKATIQTSVLDQNGDGITSSNNLTIENSYIKNSARTGISILTSTSSDTKITNTLLTTNATSGISIGGGRTVAIKNATLFDNVTGIVETGTNTTTTITNTIVQKSNNEGINLKGANSTVRYSNSYQNGTNYSPTALASAEGNLSVDSGFVSSTQFQLSASSQVKNKGIPTEKNTDGSRIDMGAFGGSPILLAANGVPVIRSTPPQFVKPGQNYSYELVANDPDGDALSYVVLNNNIPSWLKQDKNKFTGTPSRSDIGYFGIMVVVSDRKGGNVVQPISINVLPEGRAIPTETPTQPTSTPIPNVAPQVTILSPTASSVFSKDFKVISWSINQGVNIDSYTIKYSNDGQNFTTITKLPGTSTSYTWTEVEKLTNGKYFIRVEATDKGNPPVTVGSTSQQFEVKNPEVQTTDTITITKINPADNDVVQSRRQVIVVEFQPENDLDKTQTKLLINGKEVAYDTTRKTIFHQPNADYQGNTVQVEARLVTAKGGKASRQWSFNIQATTTPNDTTPTTDTRESVCFPGSTTLCVPNSIGLAFLACLILVLLLLILYFVVKFIKTLRDQREGNLEAEFTEYYEDKKDVTPQPTNIDITQTPAYQENQPSQDMSQYYSTDQQTTQEQLQFTGGEQLQYQGVESDKANEYTQTGNQSDYNKNNQPTSVQYTDDNAPVATYPQQYQNDLQFAQGATSPETNQQAMTSDQTFQTGNANDQYIQDLKSKYGITDDAINQYNQNQAGTPTIIDQGQNEQNPNQKQT